MLWYGIKDHGLAWVADWLFTQDNWLLSLVPFQFIGYAIFGPNTLFAIALGWLIFVLSAFVAVAIAWRLGAPCHAPLVFIALLNVSLYAHLLGFVSYSTSHNITNLFGLGAVLALIHWVARPRHLTLFVLLLLTAGAVSDPWMLASFNLPITLGAIAMAIGPARFVTRVDGMKLLIVAVFSIVATKTQLFTLLGFLPGVQFLPAPWTVMNANAVFLGRDLGALLNLVPATTMGDFLPGLVSLLLVIAYLQTRVTRLVQDRETLGPVVPLIAAVCLLSVGGIIAAFILSSVEAMLQSGRFVIDCAYLIVIAIAVLAEMAPARNTRFGRGFATTPTADA